MTEGSLLTDSALRLFSCWTDVHPSMYCTQLFTRRQPHTSALTFNNIYILCHV